MKLEELEAKLKSPNLSHAQKTLLSKVLNKLKEKEQTSGDSRSAQRSEDQPSTNNNSDKPQNNGAEKEFTISLPEPEILLNEQQQLAVDYALAGYSFVITGAAGTGKTTSLKSIVKTLIAKNKCGILDNRSQHKYLRHQSPGIVCISYTNKAVENMKKRLPSELHSNCMTAHKLLEFQPVYFEIDDPANPGKFKKTMNYEPKRTSNFPLPSSIQILVIDEATMLDVPLFNKIIDAMPHDFQLILMGDIQQLPPVFGKSIFIHAMQRKMLIVELTQVYRQALDNPILALAHRILSGKVIPQPELDSWNIEHETGKLTIMPWKKKLTDLQAHRFMLSKLPQMIDAGVYNPEVDIILTPFNVNFGTDMMNTIIASHLAKKLNSPVWEIFTGQKKVYLRVGERVLHNKSEAVVVHIAKNPSYFGKQPRPSSTTMDYQGREHDKEKVSAHLLGEDSDDPTMSAEDLVDHWLAEINSPTQDGDSPARRAASHIVTVKSLDTGEETKLTTAGDINGLLLGYSITVHKSQGSEYERVFFITHHSQAIMFQREILYVAVTRAKKELVCICPPELFVKGITSQKIPGKAIEEKIEGFERALKLDAKRGSGNEDQIPRELDRFIHTEDELQYG